MKGDIKSMMRRFSIINFSLCDSVEIVFNGIGARDASTFDECDQYMNCKWLMRDLKISDKCYKIVDGSIELNKSFTYLMNKVNSYMKVFEEKEMEEYAYKFNIEF